MLEKAIRSVLAQTYKDFEYIIVDNASTDNTRKVIEKYAKKDKRIKYVYEEVVIGTHCKPLNTGILHSTGNYITYLDDDNEYYPYKLEISVNALKQNPEIDVVYCDMMVHSGEESTMGIALDFDPQFLLNRNYIDTSEVMHKRDVVFCVGGWNEKVNRFTDWNLWVRMAKWGAKFQRIPIIALKYNAHGGDTQSKRTGVKSWYDPTYGLTMFEPTFDPAGDFIYLPYLGDECGDEDNPKVAVFTMTYERLDYTRRMAESMARSAGYPFDWFVLDQGSDDGTPKWLKDSYAHFIHLSDTNMGITKASNLLLDAIGNDYQIIVKVDNDCEFLTKNWLHTLVDLWKRNHMLYMSPYPEGLVHNPGGAPRIGHAYVGPYMVEVTQHIGGLCAFVDARAYKDFRWEDQFKHGNQDMEASVSFRKQGYMPCYIPLHRVWHMDNTEGQYKKYPTYFERRVKEKTEVI